MQYLGAVSKTTEWYRFVSRQTIQHQSNLSQCLNYWCQRSWHWPVLWRPTTPSRTNTHTHTQNVLFISGDWNAKVGSQEIPGITGKFCLGVQNEAGQRPTVLSRDHDDHTKHNFPTTQEMTLRMHLTRYLVNMKIRSIIFFVVKDGETPHNE